MYSGDTLSVLLFLVGALLASGIGAITAPQGWRSHTLWGLTSVFALATIGWLVAPVASPIMASIAPFAVSMVESNALAMVIVVGVVALMLGGRRGAGQSLNDPQTPEAIEDVPSFAASTDNRSKWSPDIPFNKGMLYVGRSSTWANRSRNVAETKVLLITALSEAKITAWGKGHPSEEELVQIAQAFWYDADVTAETNCAFSSSRNVKAYDVHLSEEELELVWPRRSSG